MPDTTPRLGIVTPTGAEAPNTNAAYKAIADQVDALVAMYGQGTLAARPVSTPGSPGKQGRYYVVTSGAELGEEYYDYGTGWILINPDQTPGPLSITTAMLQDLAVTTAKINDLAVTEAKLAALAVTAAKISNALKPSAGAGAAVEALRALGTAAGTAAAGTHGSQHALAGADPLPADSVAASQIQAGAVGGSELAAQTIDVKAGSYSLVLGDRFKLIRMDAAGANTLTIPTNASQAFAVGDSIDIIQWGTGQVTIAPAGGVTLVGNPGLKIIGQYAMATVIKMATDTWVAVGALTP